MKLVTYIENETTKLGVLSPDGQSIYPAAAAGADYEDVSALLKCANADQLAALEALAAKDAADVAGLVAYDERILEAPMPYPAQEVICLGINYMDHAVESARFKKEAFGGDRPYAVYFCKRVNKAGKPYGTVPAHADICDSLDYEAELAVIIGKDAYKVSEEEAKDYVFGYTVLNDVSARNVQTQHKQWYFGKSLDGFTPFGPCIATRDDFAYPPALHITSYVNGEPRQNDTTDHLIFGIDHIISELSQGMTLKAGTIIATGTPAGVGMGMIPPTFLKPGDVVECKIDGIGSIRNTIVD